MEKQEVKAIQPRFVSVKAAAAYLGFSPKTLYNRIGPRAADPFPLQPRRIGKKVLFDRLELERFADGLGN
jgi:predicted DNA-binding transcriptional regulator AlpA